MIGDRSIGYSTPVEFVDPLKAASSEWHGAGLRFQDGTGGTLSPIVIVWNVGGTPSDVEAVVAFTESDGFSGVERILDLRLLAGEVKFVGPEDILERMAPRLEAGIVSAGLEIRYSTAPGTVVATALSVDSTGDRVFRVPLVDPSAVPSSTGGYPWNLRNGSSTLVYVKNVTDSEQRYTLQLDFPGGVYSTGLKTIGPGRTDLLDVGALRRDRVPDAVGVTLPEDAEAGQVLWSVQGPVDHVLVGRSEQIDATGRMSTTYACANCCADSFYAGWVEPFSESFPYDSSMQYSAIQQNRNCYGTIMSPFSVGASWSSGDTSVATVGSGSGLTSGQYPGTTDITGSWTVYGWAYQGPSQGCVLAFSFPIFPSGGVEVTPRVFSISGRNTVPVGTVNSTPLTAMAGPSGGTYDWSVLSGTVGLDSTSTETVNVSATTDSNSVGDQVVQLVYTVNGLNSLPKTHSLTAQKPDHVVLVNGNLSTSNCPAGQAGPFLSATLEVRDKRGMPIQYAGIPVSDIGNLTPNPGQNGCGISQVITNQFVTDGSGRWPDDYPMCSSLCPGGSCTSSFTQVFNVNSFEVAPLTVTYSCNDITVQ